MNKIIVAALASTLLAGCQSLFGTSAKLDVRPGTNAGQPASAAIALEEGRQHLTDGNLGSAIAALRNATLDPATAPSAHNALGVAYAMLGRGDLAERYFRQAVEEDPGDARFAANLSRFYASREAMLAKREAVVPPIAVALVAPEAAAPAPVRTMQAGPSTVRIELPTPANSVTRVSRQEVVIRTQASQPPAAMADVRRRNPRFSAARPANAASAYPVRIDLAVAAKR
jgi:tetratricopeptide (TPR) repeat protein